MSRTNLNSECDDLEVLINDLIIGKETCETEDFNFTQEDAIEYLQSYLQELKEINNQIQKQGNTSELLKSVYNKYTEFWLFGVKFSVNGLPRIIGGLMHYPNSV
ncbi:MAG: hypothetical protein J5562_09210 [Clostridia bacterium]|nr:hypothetical protein [Clostridia bacterium]